MPNNWTVDDIHELANDILLQSQGGDVSPDLSDYVGVYALNADLFESASGNPIIIEEAREQAVMKLTAELPYKADGWTEINIYAGIGYPFDKSIFSNIAANIKTVTLNAKPNTTYVARTTLPLNTQGNANVFFCNSSINPTTQNAGVWEGNDRTFTTDADGIIRCLYRNTAMPDPTKTILDYVYMVIEQDTETVYTLTFDAAVYGGSLDVLTGELTSTFAADGSPLAEPVIYQLEPQTVMLLDGYNVIYSDAGNLEISYRR